MEKESRRFCLADMFVKVICQHEATPPESVSLVQYKLVHFRRFHVCPECRRASILTPSLPWRPKQEDLNVASWRSRVQRARGFDDREVSRKCRTLSLVRKEGLFLRNYHLSTMSVHEPNDDEREQHHDRQKSELERRPSSRSASIRKGIFCATSITVPWVFYPNARSMRLT